MSDESNSFEGQWGSDAIAEMLRRADIPYVPFTSGSSFRGLHESLVNYLGDSSPQMILSLHEEHCISMAHAYYKITGKPLVALVHTNVGLMHATMTLYNAWCDRIPMVLLMATGPLDAEHRDRPLEWVHTVNDPATLVRDYTKWDDQPTSINAFLKAVLRAKKIATTVPRAPTFLSMDLDLQEQEVDPAQLHFPDPSRSEPPDEVTLGREGLRTLSERLFRADHPVILSGRMERNRAAWDVRVKLAETLAAPVISDLKAGATFPTEHPLHVGPPGLLDLHSNAEETLREADLVLSLDWIDLGTTFKQTWNTTEPPPEVIHLSPDIHLHRGWSNDHQAHVSIDWEIPALPSTLLSELIPALKETLTEKEQQKINNRREKVTYLRENPVRTSHDELTHPAMASALQEVRGDRKICLIRIPIRWSVSPFPFRGPLDYLGEFGGGGIGRGPGLAVGGALALQDAEHLPVAIMGDGDFLMSCNALWTASYYDLPLLIIVSNNRGYHIDYREQITISQRRGRSKETAWKGQLIDDPPVDIPGLAVDFGFRSEETITRVEDLTDAFERGLQAVEAGDQYLIDIQTEHTIK